MQHYHLGQFLRKRYDGFISKDYSPYEIQVQSSDVDRALMSASTNLAGLYPPADNFSTWNANLKWQPIPIHSITSSLDNVTEMNLMIHIGSSYLQRLIKLHVETIFILLRNSDWKLAVHVMMICSISFVPQK